MVKEIFKQTIKSFLFRWWLGSSGAVNVILQFGKIYFNLDLTKSIIWGVSITAGLYILLFLYYLFLLLFKNWLRKTKESIYGEAIIYLKDAFGKIHFLRKDGNLTDEALKQTLANFCQQLKVFFEKKTKTKCAVSIKVVQNIVGNEQAANAVVYNLCRDKESQYRDTDAYKGCNHSVFNNTCYNNILTKITGGKSSNSLHYLNNNLPKTKDYNNTSWEIHKQDKSNNQWKLPYKSELVLPIIPIENKPDGKYNLVGFLCVDSDETDVFHEKYDPAMLQGVADGIYDIIVNFCCK